MTKYVLTYHGGGSMPETPEEQEELMAAWGGWFAGLGDAVVDGGNPIAESRTVQPDGSVTNGGEAPGLSGYSLLQADSFDAALEAAKGCPVLASGGLVQVSEAIDM